MKTKMLAVPAAVILCGLSSGALAASPTPAKGLVDLKCTDFSAMTADAQDAFLNGYEFGIDANTNISKETTAAVGSTAAGNKATDTVDANAMSGVNRPDLQAVLSDCQATPDKALSDELNQPASSSGQ